MVRGFCKGRQWGGGGGGATPPGASTPKGSNPHGDEHVVRNEQIVVGNVVGMMRSFQRIFEALIRRLDRDEDKASTPPEGPPHAPTNIVSIHRELEKVKFPKFFVAANGAVIEAWL
jgi:hypothetical protein